MNEPSAQDVSNRKILPAFLMCFFLGILGIHRFYVGKIPTGVLQILTLGGLGIWAFIDLIILACGKFKDGQGATISEWN